MTDYTPNRVCHIDDRADREQVLGAVKSGVTEANAEIKAFWLRGHPIRASRLMPEPKSPRTPEFWKRLMQNYRIGRYACNLRRWPAIKSAWTYTRMGC